MPQSKMIELLIKRGKLFALHVSQLTLMVSKISTVKYWQAAAINIDGTTVDHWLKCHEWCLPLGT